MAAMNGAPNCDGNELKKAGWIAQVQPDLFSVRLRVVGGRLEGHQLAKLQEVAERFGRGRVHLTTRQGVEIPFVSLQYYEEVRAALASAGLSIGVSGPSVRTITACPGNEICSHGLVDTQAAARLVDNEFYGKSGIPHKMKIGFSGCPNGCAKPAENDLGFMGRVIVAGDASKCTGCGRCVHVCRFGAISLVDGKLKHDEGKCRGCGDCLTSCPKGAWTEVARGFAVYAGGMFGRTPQVGRRVGRLVRPHELVALVERVKEWYNKHGRAKERFGLTLNRVGLKSFEDEVFGA
jgi:dissimilatory sulfite reductase (desulfoviridin) alpha/beta subunit